ncbi:uncharacterized protein METZ01_LOCUS339035, partial [marine metagenome]
MRVHALAKEFDIKSTDFVDIIQSFGIDVKSHLSSLDDAQVADIRFKMDMKDHTKEAELSDAEFEELNPLGNLTQEEADELMAEAPKVVIETNNQGESAEEFNARRREEIIEENKKIEQREKEEEITKYAKSVKQEQLDKVS